MVRKLFIWVGSVFEWVLALICGKDKLPSVRVLMAIWLMMLITKMVNKYLDLINKVSQVDNTILWMIGMLLLSIFLLIGLLTWQNVLDGERILKGQKGQDSQDQTTSDVK